MDIEKIIKAEADESGNIPAAKISAVVTAIKQAVGNEFVDRKRYADKIAEIDALKAEAAKSDDAATAAEQLKVKYEALKAEYKDFKADIKRREEHDTKAEKFREVLTAAGVPEKYHKSICKVSGNIIDGITTDESGTIKDLDKLTANAKENWADFIPVVTVSGAAGTSPTLPNNTGGRKYTSQAEIMQIKDTQERQKAIRENLDLFGYGAS